MSSETFPFGAVFSPGHPSDVHLLFFFRQDLWSCEDSAQDEAVKSEEDGRQGIPLLHPLYLLGYSASLAASTRLATLSCSHSSFIVLVVLLLRSVGCISLPSLSAPLRPIVTYLAGLIGILAAKYTESSMMQPTVVPLVRPSSTASAVAHRHRLSIPDGVGSSSVDTSSPCDSRLLTARRRRTSSAALTSSSLQASQTTASPTQAVGAVQAASKARRTSLPALLANKNHYHSSVSPCQSNQGLE